jgi:hypothetical protein
MIYRIYVRDPVNHTVLADTETKTASARVALYAFSELIRDSDFTGGRLEANFSARDWENKKHHIAAHHYDAPPGTPDNWIDRENTLHDALDKLEDMTP